MNSQAHMSGQVPNQNGVPLSSQMQNTGNQSELIRARVVIRQELYDILMRRHLPTHEIQAKKLKDIVMRLEEDLFRRATSKEEYMNVNTLENRLLVLIKSRSPHSQPLSGHSSTSSTGSSRPYRMYSQTHMSGLVPNQNEGQFSASPQQTGAPLSSQMQSTGNQSEMIRDRGVVRQKIYDILMRRHQPTDETEAQKMEDIVRRLEEGLFRGATSKEQYMNFDTLENRLHVMINSQSLHNQSFVAMFQRMSI